jgi:hypothetical protein
VPDSDSSGYAIGSKIRGNGITLNITKPAVVPLKGCVLLEAGKRYRVVDRTLTGFRIQYSFEARGISNDVAARYGGASEAFFQYGAINGVVEVTASDVNFPAVDDLKREAGMVKFGDQWVVPQNQGLALARQDSDAGAVRRNESRLVVETDSASCLLLSNTRSNANAFVVVPNSNLLVLSRSRLDGFAQTVAVREQIRALEGSGDHERVISSLQRIINDNPLALNKAEALNLLSDVKSALQNHSGAKTALSELFRERQRQIEGLSKQDDLKGLPKPVVDSIRQALELPTEWRLLGLTEEQVILAYGEAVRDQMDARTNLRQFIHRYRGVEIGVEYIDGVVAHAVFGNLTGQGWADTAWGLFLNANAEGSEWKWTSTENWQRTDKKARGVYEDPYFFVGYEQWATLRQMVTAQLLKEREEAQHQAQQQQAAADATRQRAFSQPYGGGARKVLPQAPAVRSGSTGPFLSYAEAERQKERLEFTAGVQMDAASEDVVRRGNASAFVHVKLRWRVVQGEDGLWYVRSCY